MEAAIADLFSDSNTARYYRYFHNLPANALACPCFRNIFWSNACAFLQKWASTNNKLLAVIHVPEPIFRNEFKGEIMHQNPDREMCELNLPTANRWRSFRASHHEMSASASAVSRTGLAEGAMTSLLCTNANLQIVQTAYFEDCGTTGNIFSSATNYVDSTAEKNEFVKQLIVAFVLTGTCQIFACFNISNIATSSCWGSGITQASALTKRLSTETRTFNSKYGQRGSVAMRENEKMDSTSVFWHKLNMNMKTAIIRILLVERRRRVWLNGSSMPSHLHGKHQKSELSILRRHCLERDGGSRRRRQLRVIAVVWKGRPKTQARGPSSRQPA